MTMSRDLVNHKKKWSCHKIDARNRKSEIKLVKMSILKPLTFKCMILERFGSLKNVKEICEACYPAVFHINLR